MRLDRYTPRSERMKLVREILGDVGLLKCIHTRIGDASKGKTLSGGERKRLSFATELLTKPPLLFLDEPTTGLDAYSAQQLVLIMQKMTKYGTTIVCTIHQPSSQLYAMFQQVLLLYEGRTAFMGSPSEAISFFASHGFRCPSTFNPADYFISLLATKTPPSDDDQLANRLCDAYAISKIPEIRNNPIETEISFEHTTPRRDDFRKPFWLVTIYWLTYRNFLIVIRDPTIQTLRIVQKIAIALMAGLCFLGTIDLSQRGIQSIQGAVFILISENTFSPMYSVLALFPQGFPLFIRERRSGLYDTVQYYLSNIIALTPGLAFEPILFDVILYWMAGLRASFYAFTMTLLITICVVHVATACGCFFSTAFNSVPVSIACLVPFDVSLLITSGVFIQLNTIPFFLKWLKYLSWMMYANEAMTIVQWEGVKNITCNDGQLPCLSTADDVFDQYSFSPSNFNADLMALGILYLCFNAFAFFFLWRRARNIFK